MLSEKALRRAMWGWGRFGKSRVYDENGKDISTTDGLWIITLGISGIVGLTAVTAIYLLPGIRFWWRTRAADWSDPSFAAISAFSVILGLYAIDNILNAMVNPVITVCMGAVTAAALRRMTPEAVTAAAPSSRTSRCARRIIAGRSGRLSKPPGGAARNGRPALGASARPRGRARLPTDRAGKR